MAEPIRLNLFIDPEADPELYRYLSALHPRRRCERIRFLAEQGLAAERTGTPLHTQAAEARNTGVRKAATSGSPDLGSDLADLY
ncbi:hypothetical protein [Methylocaldum sp. SAD2]|jgi:hypothetical protein|uniref:hypothetical protein n=1 Tax=Methylocaldum sp. GT1BB TaxID=3438963 RepID=UPI000A326F6D